MEFQSNRNWMEFKISSVSEFKSKCMEWVQKYPNAVILDSCNNVAYGKPEYDFIIAAGVGSFIELEVGKTFSELQQFINQHNDWLFGFFGYDLKNEIENFRSENIDRIGFSDMIFFIPVNLIIIKDNKVSIGILNQLPLDVFNEIDCIHPIDDEAGIIYHPIKLNNRVSKEEYISTIEKIREHIRNGDVYELNYCMEFYATESEINPLAVFKRLTTYSQAPFSGFMRWDDKYLMCASPERFLKKSGSIIKSQPIKGTIRRGDNPVEDAQLKETLAESKKDKAENVMITDLVRNDLTRYAKTGTIKVDELFGVYSFKHVHQMISTISAELEQPTVITEVIKNAFPMGSMTGAPKVMALQLIELYEKTKRGLFSGSFGYISPQLDFDFNVVIRSVLYNQSEKYISVQAGSAITWDSDADEEYAECRLKVQAISTLLQSAETS